jgi:hypothetical protein
MNRHGTYPEHVSQLIYAHGTGRKHQLCYDIEALILLEPET